MPDISSDWDRFLEREEAHAEIDALWDRTDKGIDCSLCRCNPCRKSEKPTLLAGACTGRVKRRRMSYPLYAPKATTSRSDCMCSS